jgi:hypothetical protein
MQNAKIEEDLLAVGHEIARFKEDVAVLKTQLAGLGQEKLRSSVLFQKLGEYFGFGAAGKLDWVRFKLKYKQEELARCEAEQARLDAPANGPNRAPKPPPAPPIGFSL